MIPTPVARAVDFCVSLPMTPHMYYGLATSYAAPSMGVACETPAYTPMCWSYGAFTGAHKFARQVKSMGFWSVQTGHKLGPLVIHIQAAPAPDNLLTAVHLALSSWEVKFQNGECLVQGEPLGSLLPVLMNGLTCTDVVSMPIGFSFTTLYNSVWHHTSLVDLVAGWVEWCVSCVFEILAFGPVKKVTRVQVLADALFPSRGGVGLAAAGSFVSSLAGAGVRSVGREFFGYGGTIGAQIEVGLGVLGGVKVEVKHNHDGSWTAGAEGVLGPGLASEAVEYGQDAHGNESVQSTSRRLNQSTQRTAAEQPQSDGAVRTQRQTTITDALRGTQTQSKPQTSDGDLWL